MTSHAVGGRKLSRKQGPRLALYKNLIVSVLRYERIQTTEAKAKEIRPQVEQIITLAKTGRPQRSSCGDRRASRRAACS